MRVALLAPCFWPEVRRGTERFTRELADGLIKAGHSPRLITSHPALPGRRVEDGLPITRLPRPPQQRLLRRGYEPYLTHVPLSYAALRLGSDDVAHAVYPADALAAARWSARTRRPAVLSYMGIPDRVGLRDKRKRLEVLQAALRGCAAVVALSEHAANEFRHTLGYEARVIAPGVDLTTFKPAPARNTHPTIICPADPSEPRKNVGLLVEAFELVRAERPDAELVLSNTALDDRAGLARAYGEAWLAVLPSRAEAFGLVLVEALACGTPVVGYDDGAIPEVIGADRSIGRLFDTLDPAALAATLLDALALAADPKTAERCRARASEFSSERTTEAYLELYRELGA
ncbi:MAG: glycosyltransferase family 4 protein [Solirubrobacteraceae bacterium]